MAPLEGRPFLDLLLGHLNREGMTDIVLSTGFRGEFIEGHYHHHPGLKLKREPFPMGTGGAIKFCQGELEFPHDYFFVLNGDSYCPLSFQKMWDLAWERRPWGMVALVEREETSEYGRVDLGPEDRVVRFGEKEKISGPALVNAGIYLFSRDLFQEIPETAVSLEREILPRMIEEGKRMMGYRVALPFWDIGTKERLELARREIPAFGTR